MAAKQDSNKTKKSSKAKSSGKQYPIKLWGIIVAIVAFTLYANTLGHEYAFDDYSVIKENYIVKQGLEGIPTLATTHYRYGYWASEGSLYRPLSLIMFALEWELAPDYPFIGHLMNVLLYAITGFILFITLFQLFGKSQIYAAFVISLLFISHPLHTEVVANIKSRDEILVLLFGLLSLYSLLLGQQEDKKRYRWWSLCFFTLALFSKESAITWLAVLFLAVYFFKKQTIQRSFRTTVPFLLPTLLFLMVRHFVIGKTGGLEDKVSILDNLLVGAGNDWLVQSATAIKIMGLYLWKLFVPYPLVSDMGFDQITLTDWSDPKVIGSFLIWAGIAAAGFTGFIRKKKEAFGPLYLLATISIYSNLVIIIGSSYGERFLYSPSLAGAFGIYLLIAALIRILKLEEQSPLSKLPRLQQPVLLSSLPIILIFSVLTIQRNPDWKNSFSIYQADVEKSPECAKIHYHLGLEIVKKALAADNQQRREGLSAAHREFEKAIEIYPRYGDAYAQLGLNFYRQKETKLAMDYYNQSLSYKPNNATVYSNMGIIFFESGQLEEAKKVYEKAVELNPRYVDALRNLGVIHALKKEFDKAIAFFSQGLQYDPENATLLYYLGSAYKDKGDPSAATPYFEKAYRLDPSLRK